ncbi:MAG: apolipoprotein N-acyltransferase [Planctomycetaceae bacterium]|jgi:apolipoprotein N-acyltransferase|nr:apolipoprotein N-acyltransferase [Planctomycetaceae bacterium]
MKSIGTDEKKNRLFSKVHFLFIAGVFCYCGSLPPYGFWLLVFLVPVFWTFVIEHPKPICFRIIYFVTFCFWSMVLLGGIICSHQLTVLVLLLFAAYLSIYWSLFVYASRIAVCRFGIPSVWAVPVCWIGCEYLRNHLFGGFSSFSLEHALYSQPLLIQIADIGGRYLVGGMIMLVGAGVASGIRSLWKRERSVKRYGWCFVAGFVFVATLGYGFFQTAGSHISQSNLTIAVLQGNIPLMYDDYQEQAVKAVKQFIDLTKKAAQNAQTEQQPLDLIITPEAMASIRLLKYKPKLKPAEFDRWADHHVDYWEDRFVQLRTMVQRIGVPVLVGLLTFEFERPPKPKEFNSAMLIDPKNDQTEYRYDKMRLLMVGEYVPFSQYLPKNSFLKALCPELECGTKPVVIPLDGGRVLLAVNICYESTLPHFIRNQILTLKKQGQEPAILVNMSNDAWFLFSQQIDQHFATHVFRAVENRRPYVTSSNAGFSAIIDSRGVIQKIGKRREAEVVTGSVSTMDYRTPVYHYIGDLPSMLCMLGVFVLIFMEWYKNGNILFTIKNSPYYLCKSPQSR